MFSASDIRKLMDAFERSDWDEIHLSADGVEIHVSSGEVVGSPPLPPSAPPDALAPVAAPAPAAPSPPPPAAVAAPASVAADGAGTDLADASMDGAHAVRSPSPGIFWRSPAPGEPPFVELGQSVSPDTPIGIVEVMKLMNQVLAGVTGTVRAVLTENGARVERDEPMVLIDPGS